MDFSNECENPKAEKSFQIETLKEELHKQKFRLNVRQHLETDYEEDLRKLEREKLQNDKIQTEQIENLNRKLVETKAQCTSLESKCLTLEEEKISLNQELKEKCRNLAQLEGQPNNSAFELQLETAKKKLFQLEKENCALNEKLRNLQNVLVAKNQENNITEQNLIDSNEKLREYELLLADRRQMNHEIETELAETRIELETLKMRLTKDENHAGKGNSLFSEVNDHRLKVENYASSLKHQNELLNDEIKLLKKEKHNLKTQIAKMFRLSSSNEGVSSEIRLLQDALSSKKAELNSMHTKYDELRSDLVNFSKQNGSKFTPLDELVRVYKSQNESLRLENEKERMQKLLSEDKILETQRNLCKMTAETDRLRAELIFVQTNFLNDEKTIVVNKTESTLKLASSSSNFLRTKQFEKSSLVDDQRAPPWSNDETPTNNNESKTSWHSAIDETIKISGVLSSSIDVNKENNNPDETIKDLKNVSNQRSVKATGRKINSQVIKISNDVV